MTKDNGGGQKLQSVSINIGIRLDEDLSDLNGAKATRRRATRSNDVIFRLCCKSGHPDATTKCSLETSEAMVLGCPCSHRRHGSTDQGTDRDHVQGMTE